MSFILAPMGRLLASVGGRFGLLEIGFVWGGGVLALINQNWVSIPWTSSKTTKVGRENEVSIPRWNTATMLMSGSSQRNSMSSRWDTWNPFVSKSCRLQIRVLHSPFHMLLAGLNGLRFESNEYLKLLVFGTWRCSKLAGEVLRKWRSFLG